MPVGRDDTVKAFYGTDFSLPARMSVMPNARFLGS